MSEHCDPGPELVERLVRLDERLRGGVATAETLEEEQSVETVELAGLRECLQVLESRWPRHPAAPQPAPQGVNSGLLHPALSLALASGGTAPQFGKFTIQGELGRGGFGVVLLAEDTVLHRLVALKLPRPELLVDAAMKRRFLHEAKAAAAIDHPHVAPIYEAGEVGSLCYLAAAYCPGATLATWLAQLPGPPAPRLAARLVETLARALHHIHEQGILHRDLKPGNVLLWPAAKPVGPDELPFVPKLTDFGLSKVLAESLAESRSSVLMGTPLYMAPEQADGRLAEIGPASDLFALGTMLYELLTGQLPFVSASIAEVFDKIRHIDPVKPRRLNLAVPKDLEIICLRCLEKKSAERYATALALAEDLRRFLEGKEIVARPITPLARLYRWCQQPQRLREAGWTVIAIHFAMGGWTIMTAMLLAWGIVPRPADMTSDDVYRFTLPAILFVSPPLILAGAAMMRRKRWAIQFALGTGIGLTVVAVLLSLSLIDNPFAGLWNDAPGVSMLIYSMMTMLCLLQAVVSAIAWIALRAERSTTR